jgi:DNA helicase HerA-like ATPase
MNTTFPIAKGSVEIDMLGSMANRHGLIAGATGTGKTVTLKVLAEGFSRLGVPVFMADVKGDLAGISQPGTDNPKLQERCRTLGLSTLEFCPFPVMFWDVFGEQGHPVRATISDMGPLLLGRLLDLNETQSGVLTLVFKIADDSGMLLLDLKDLRAMLEYVGENAKQFTTQYGNVSTASIGAIQRGLLALDEQGGEKFFGEPALNIADLLQTDSAGRGYINILAAEKLMLSPKVYSTFLLWLLSELFETLPEAGDLEKPKLVFFFDEAHLLFDDAPKALLQTIEQVVRLIRSKGIGVYFVSQSPMDIPQDVLGQLGNRVQHALRAFTPKDQQAVKAAADTFRSSGAFNVAQAIGELAIGEALISLLDEKGAPAPVERALVYPPLSRIGPVSVEERQKIMKSSLVYGHYETVQDRDSAYERLKARAAHPAPEAAPAPQDSGGGLGGIFSSLTHSGGRSRQSPFNAALTSAARSIGTQVGRQLIRGILGSFLGGTTSRRRY